MPKPVTPFGEPELADEILETFDEICEDLEITYFLSAGTCLGFHRDHEYIPRDNDIDVRVVCSDAKFEDLIEALKEEEFVPSVFLEYSKMHFRKYDILLDVKRADETELETIDYRGKTYNVPYPVEKYLRSIYGKDWRKPRWKPRW